MKGNAVEEYALLWSYVLKIRRSNLENIVKLEINEDNKFKRIYLSFHCCEKGFLAGCRRVIGVYGSFLK